MQIKFLVSFIILVTLFFTQTSLAEIDGAKSLEEINNKLKANLEEISEKTEEIKEEKSKYEYRSEKPVEPKNKEERVKAAADDVNKMFEMLRDFSDPPSSCPISPNGDASQEGLGSGIQAQIAKVSRDKIGDSFDCDANDFTGCPADNVKCAAQASSVLKEAGVDIEGSDLVVGVVSQLSKKGWKECTDPYMPGSVAFTNPSQSAEELPQEFHRTDGYERSHIGIVTIVNGRTGIVNNKGSESGTLGVDYEDQTSDNWYQSVKFICPPPG